MPTNYPIFMNNNNKNRSINYYEYIVNIMKKSFYSKFKYPCSSRTNI